MRSTEKGWTKPDEAGVLRVNEWSDGVRGQWSWRSGVRGHRRHVAAAPSTELGGVRGWVCW